MISKNTSYGIRIQDSSYLPYILFEKTRYIKVVKKFKVFSNNVTYYSEI